MGTDLRLRSERLAVKVATLALALVATFLAGSCNGVSAPQSAVAQDSAGAKTAIGKAGLAYLARHGKWLGVSRIADIKVASISIDEHEGGHLRVQQTVKGVPVLGGEALMYIGPQGDVRDALSAFLFEPAVDPAQDISREQAIVLAKADCGCAQNLTAPPKADLWIVKYQAQAHLSWRVRMEVLDGTARTALPVVFVDAHDGSVFWRYNDLQTGTGTSLYDGNVSFGTYFKPSNSTYYMEDLVGRAVGTYTCQNGSTPYAFTDTDDVWVDAIQKAGVDAQYGITKVWDYYQSVHNRLGVDGLGGPGTTLSQDGVTNVISARVHYSAGYNNAFWDPISHNLTFGDGDGTMFSPFVSLDVVGHEATHGVTQYTANLVYSGESGALNESISDVFGEMVERSIRGETSSLWKVGSEIYTPATPGDALRYMDNPHLAADKGYTADDDPTTTASATREVRTTAAFTSIQESRIRRSI